MITINDVVPDRDLTSGFSRERCFIGVSIGNPAFRTSHLLELVEWASIEFESCLILISDSLSRHNYIVHGLSPEEMVIKSLAEGENLYKRVSGHVTDRSLSNVEIKRWDDLDFEQEKERVMYTNARQSKFRKVMFDEADAFAIRQIRSGRVQRALYSSIVSTSLEYLYEEIAAIEHLVRDGVDVSVYPGAQLGILKRMSTRDVPVPELEISRCTYVDIDITP